MSALRQATLQGPGPVPAQPPPHTGQEPGGQVECVSNISPREQRRRLLAGAIQLVISLAILAAFMATGAERGWRLGLFFLFWGAAVGYFQARDKT